MKNIAYAFIVFFLFSCKKKTVEDFDKNKPALENLVSTIDACDTIFSCQEIGEKVIQVCATSKDFFYVSKDSMNILFMRYENIENGYDTLRFSNLLEGYYKTGKFIELKLSNNEYKFRYYGRIADKNADMNMFKYSSTKKMDIINIDEHWCAISKNSLDRSWYEL